MLPRDFRFDSVIFYASPPWGSVNVDGAAIVVELLNIEHGATSS